MARGGFRPGAGRPRKDGAAPANAVVKADVVAEAQLQSKTPLEYMLDVMNDPEADKARRDRMAVAAAPFCHGKAAEVEQGKKAQRQANAEKSASAGKFAAPSAPKSLSLQ